MTEATAQIGHNEPPSPFDQIADKINELFSEAKMWLDGEPIASQGQADDLSNLKNMIRDAEKEATALLAEEVKPHRTAEKAVRERYAPLIADTKAVRGKTVLALEAIKEAQRPWEIKLAEEQAERERKAREEAETARKEAEEAARKASEAREAGLQASLEARAEREKALAAAEEAEKAAARVVRDKPKTGGGIGRATHLRETFEPTLIDPITAVNHYWQSHQPEIEGLLQKFAEQDVRAGKRDIPGFEISSVKSVV